MFATRLSRSTPCRGVCNRSGLPSRLPARWGILPLLMAAYGIGRAGIGAIQGNQVKQRNKGIISKAYEVGRQRLDLEQGDQRQSIGEGAVQRGLTQGGGVRASGPVKPVGEGSTQVGFSDGLSNGDTIQVHDAQGNRVRGNPGAPAVSVTGAYDLGSQQSADLAREQQLDQTDLARQRDTALTTNDADYANTLTGSIGAGINGALSLGGAPTGSPSTTTPSVASSYSRDEGLSQPGGMSDYPNAAWGVHPTQPLKFGAWAQSNAEFNKFAPRSP